MRSEDRVVTRWLNQAGIYAIDLLVMVVAFLGAHALRFNFQRPPDGWHHVAVYFVTVALLQFAALHVAGCYRLVWRFIAAYDVPRFVAASFLSTTAMVLLRFLLPEWRQVRPPFSIALLNGALFLSGALLIRLLWRILREGSASTGVPGTASLRSGARRVLLIGAGSAGNTVARELRQHRTNGVVVLGFLDDDPAKQGTIIQGVPVCGKVADLRDRIATLRVQEVLVTMSPAPREVIREIVHTCEACGIAIRIAPGYFEILDGTLSVSRLREIEIADLLGREEVDLASDADLARFVTGRRVMVTGAGGSIGSELARQVARLGPESLVLVDRCEEALYEIDRALREAGKGEILRPVVADIGDGVRIGATLARYRPQILLHAAAHKHVPMMESNEAEAVRNNVLATRELGEQAIRAGVEVFVQLSTDKAVNPSSIMGATKRLAEFVLQDLNSQGRTRFAAVRFGNVLGASGSVVPLFRDQIRAGGPVTVTHPDMRRYFMTTPEAARLVLQAAAIAAGGEIFILDMGEPMRIVELAEEMIRLSGLRPYEDIPIIFTGTRPGEKLFEELSTDAERADRTRHPRIFIGKIAAPAPSQVAGMLDRLRTLCEQGAPDAQVRQALVEIVPENSLRR